MRFRVFVPTVLVATVLATSFAAAEGVAAQTPAGLPAASVGEDGAAGNAEATTNYRLQRYRADYVVNADAGNVQTEHYQILLNTRSGVEQFSQVRLSYSEKMETLEVLEAYTVTAEGERRNVAAERIHTQESYSSASAAMYADRKVRVIVFPNLAPGTQLVYSVRRTQLQPYFPGYFGLWETFSVFTRFDDAQVTLQAPAGLPMHVSSRGLQGSDRPQVRDGNAHWRWTLPPTQAMPTQNWSAATWEFSPGIMASTYRDWAQLAKAYQLKAAPAAVVTPAIHALAEQLTAGISDRREQAQTLYRWVAQNIRYVAVYLGNGGLEPNSAQSVLDNHYGDCKDHVVILEALLAAKGIASTPVLIGAGGGPTLPAIPVLGRFNHAISYIPEFDLYLDSTTPWARAGQLPEGDLGAPVLLTASATLARTPEPDERRNGIGFEMDMQYQRNGDVSGQLQLQPGDAMEMDMRDTFAQLTAQNRARVEAAIVASAGMDGQGELRLLSDPQLLTQPFSYRFKFRAQDVVDFSVVGGIQLPLAPSVSSMRTLYTRVAASSNATPFACVAGHRREVYRLQFPAEVPIMAVPADIQFANAAGSYRVQWRRDGQQMVAEHELREHAVRGAGELCQPEDYPAFRALYQQVRRGFRGQVVHGQTAAQRAP